MKKVAENKSLPCFWIGRVIKIKMAIVPKAVYKIPTKITTQFFTDFEGTILKFIWKKNLRIAKTILYNKAILEASPSVNEALL